MNSTSNMTAKWYQSARAVARRGRREDRRHADRERRGPPGASHERRLADARRERVHLARVTGKPCWVIHSGSCVELIAKNCPAGATPAAIIAMIATKLSSSMLP
jgi:hypothetical protein